MNADRAAARADSGRRLGPRPRSGPVAFRRRAGEPFCQCASSRPAPPRGPRGLGALRDRTTRILYLVAVNWGFVLYAVSSSIPQLALDLGVSKAVAGLHGTVLSAGSVAMGLILAPMAARLGRRRAIVAGLVVGAAACLVMSLGPTAAVTVPAATAMAAALTLAVALANAALVARKGAGAAAALAESCSYGAAVGCLAPLTVGAAVAIGWGWRAAVAVEIPLALATAYLMVRLPASAELDSVRSAAGGASGAARPSPFAAPRPLEVGAVRSAPVFAAFAAFTALGTMAEMGIVFWAAQLLVDQTGAGAAAAAAAVTAFTVGLAVGRWLTGPMALRRSPLGLAAAGLVALLGGWATLWTAAALPVAVAALFVMGLGAGPCYPFALTLTLRHSPLGLDSSQAILMVAGGLSGALAPFALGWLGDRVGVHAAYTAIGWVVAAGLAAAGAGWLALRRARRDA